MMMDKIAIVVQRYSTDVNGGAELHARLLAEHLIKKIDVEILTTCAIDYITWDNYYKEGIEYINDIKVIRFKSEKKDLNKNRILSRYLHRIQKYEREKFTVRNFVKLSLKKALYRRKKNHNEIFDEWIKAQGPMCQGLVDYINNSEYDAFIFFTYLYYPTYVGIRSVADKSILIPTAHDEPPFYFSGFNSLFSLPKFIMYNTLSEKELVEKTYTQSRNIKSDIAGVGFDKPTLNPDFNKNIDYKYFVYIGRIDINKGCKELIDFFEYFKKTSDNNIKLVLIGNNFMNKLKPSNNIILTGFVDEQEKLFYLKNSQALIIPSKFESLSMVTLEAMVMGKPVIANGECEVLKNHIELSNAGYVYHNREDFSAALHKTLALSKEEKEQIANKGMSYVEKNYQWSSIIDKFVKAIDYIKNNE